MVTVELDDGAEDVNDFLRRIKELGEKRDKEDAERTRKLEEEILEGRRQREFRRAGKSSQKPQTSPASSRTDYVTSPERARSLSPEKQSPSTTPRHIRSPGVLSKGEFSAASSSLSDTTSSEASLSANVLDNVVQPFPVITDQSESELPRSGALHDADPVKVTSQASKSDTSSGKYEPLPWQRRGGTLRGTRNRPISMIEKPSLQTHSLESNPKILSDNTMPSRAQIAQTLGSKDPLWFRQTADRITTAKPRSVDADENTEYSAIEKRRLVGMSMVPDLPATAKPKSSASVSRSPYFSSTEEGISTVDDRIIQFAPAKKSPASPLTNSQRSGPPNLADAFTPASVATIDEPRSLDREAHTGRLSPGRAERPLSPTKGMGGFVQSAMLKRSDSISKRWNIQAPTGLSGPDSTVPMESIQSPDRGEIPAFYTSQNIKQAELKPDNSKSTELHGSNCSVNHSSSKVFVGEQEPAVNFAPGTDFRVDSQLMDLKYEFSGQRRTDDAGNLEDLVRPRTPVDSMPSSPSKRWSPTKSSWLESALSKPESPKPKPLIPHQPAWMSEIQRNKKDRAEKSSLMNDERTSLDSRAFAPSDGNRITPDYSQLVNTKPEVKTPNHDDARALRHASLETSVLESSSKTSQAVSMKPLLALKPNLSQQETHGIASKPAAPPTKDFRTNLRANQSSSPRKVSEELEFRNVFGKLKRANTEKYVATDEFKGNILKGKAALAVTGGPEKSIRKDEFKESILQKKEAMRDKAAESGTSVYKPRKPETLKPLVPEAIARRKTLAKHDSRFVSNRNSVHSPSTATETVKVPMATMEIEKSPKTSRAPQSFGSESVAVSSSETGTLADRFNPGLANLLSKRPYLSPTSTTPRNYDPPTVDTFSDVLLTRSTEDERPNAPLQHMTKARARGPKRRGPTANMEAAEPTLSSAGFSNMDGIPKDSVISPTSTSRAARPSPVISSAGFIPPKPSMPVKQTTFSSMPRAAMMTEKSNPIRPTPKSPPLPSKPSAFRSADSLKAYPPKAAIQSDESIIATISPPPSAALKKIPYSEFNTTFTSKVLNASPKPRYSGSQSEGTSVIRRQDIQVGKGSNPQLDVGKLPDIISPDSTITILKKEPVGLPVNSSGNSNISGDVLKQQNDEPKPSPKDISVSLKTHNFNARDMIFGAFKEKPVLPTVFDTNVLALLQFRQESPDMTKTEHKNFNEITGDGKLIDVPTNQEHILYDKSMYLCKHTSADDNGRKDVKVLLWVGSSVPESSIEDVQLFARKMARESNSKLSIIRQGKETKSFFRAIGGILVTRRGSPTNNAKSYMLCGRQHLGHIAFDEVSLSYSNLCSGFPFIIVSSAGTSFIWRGKGCSAEELGCSRLISMDLGQNGEVIEIDEGKETEDFLANFPKSSLNEIRANEEYWQLKATTEKYTARLFQIDESSSSAQITEIVPFTHADLSASNIFLLDAFFKIFIIVGSMTQSKAQSFSSALVFAQEYRNAAAATGGRNFTPEGSIVMKGVTPDIAACFRSWDGNQVSKGEQPLLIPLDLAIAALRPA